MNQIKATVVIPTYNKKPRLKVVLESFNFQNANRSDFEVVLVDDGSNDDTKTLIDEIHFDYNFRYFFQDNQGRSAARNKGIEESKGEILVFCDDDTIPSDSFIERHISNHKSSGQFVVHGAIFDLPPLKFFKDPVNGVFYDTYGADKDKFKSLSKNILPPDLRLLSNYLEKNKRISGFEKLVKRLFDEGKNSLKWMACTGGNFSVKKSQLQKSGGFNEQFGKKWGCEDLELGYRLYKLGTQFRYCHEADNYHITHVRGSYQEDISNSVSLFKQIHPDASEIDLENLLLGNYGSL
jgi:glycosyltransferase involved in cell wall biosynthesis